MSQKGYLIAEAKVGDAEAYEIYKALAQAAIAEHGGRYLVRGGAAEILEGKWVNVPRLVIVEFDSVEQARRFYHSPEYQAARQTRLNAAEMNMLVVAGVVGNVPAFDFDLAELGDHDVVVHVLLEDPIDRFVFHREAGSLLPLPYRC